MTLKAWIYLLAALLVALALCSWALEGTRWVASGGRRTRPAF